MAQKVQVLLTCDLEDGEKPATQTVSFAADGTTYEMDVCVKHAKQFRDSLAPYVAAARRVSSRGTGAGRRGRAGGSADRERTQAIRVWARKKGIKVSDRGRLSAAIVAQYEASTNK